MAKKQVIGRVSREKKVVNNGFEREKGGEMHLSVFFDQKIGLNITSCRTFKV
jgi:hypothetical protein